ncbi:MAG TPA: hypothetical protein VIL42_01790 [Sphingomicrobium sp.]
MRRITSQPAAAASNAAQVATCLIKRTGEAAPELVGGAMTTDPRFDRLSKALSGKHKACSGKSSGLPLFLINSAVAEQLIRAKNRTYPDRAAPADAAAGASLYKAAAGVTIDSVGRCLAVQSPGLVYKVVAATPGSPQEAQALANAYAQTPSCGVPAAPADIPVVEQRAALTLGLFAATHRTN